MPANKALIVALNYRFWDMIQDDDEIQLEALLEQFLVNHIQTLTSYRQMVELRRTLTALVYLSNDVLEPNLSNVKQAYGLDRHPVQYHLLDWVRDEPLTGLEVIPEPRIWMP